MRKPRPYYKNRIFNVAWKLKTSGYAETTIQGYNKRLKMLSEHTDLDNPESVKNYIARQDGWSNAYKECVVNAYVHYARTYNIQWEKPIYKRSQRLPNVPSTEQINKIIAHASRKYALVFSILRDTGLRPVELYRLSLRDIDLERGLVYPNSTKGGRPRVLKLQTATLGMLREYIHKHDFGLKEKMFPTSKVASHVFMRIRNRLVKNLCEPELKKYRLYDLRHYFATMLYHRTKDILLVKEQLGHRRLETTLIYTHLVDFRDEEFTVRAANTVKEACQLLESGFEYVTEMDNIKLFRKRK